MQEVKYIGVAPSPVHDEHSQNNQHNGDGVEPNAGTADLYVEHVEACAVARAARAIEAIIKEMQAIEDKNVHVVFALQMFVTTTQEPFHSQLAIQVVADLRRLKQQYSMRSAGGELPVDGDLDRAMILAKLTYMLEYHGFSSPVRDQLTALLVTRTIVAARERITTTLSDHKELSLNTYRKLLLFQYLVSKLKLEAASSTADAMSELWGVRVFSPYARGNIHGPEAQGAWREQTHLCCDIIFLKSNFGQLRLPAKVVPHEAVYVCDEVHLRRAMRLNDPELVAKLCLCFRILNANCSSLRLQAMEYITEYPQQADLWPSASHHLELSCICISSLQTPSFCGLGPCEPITPRIDIDLVEGSSAVLPAILEAFYTGQLTGGGFEMLPNAYSVGEKRIKMLQDQTQRSDMKEKVMET